MLTFDSLHSDWGTQILTAAVQSCDLEQYVRQATTAVVQISGLSRTLARKQPQRSRLRTSTPRARSAYRKESTVTLLKPDRRSAGAAFCEERSALNNVSDWTRGGVTGANDLTG
ncbi:hypothetical protein SKAU_G00184390 [Synaphobranchus kaupii]|uniref:Uncharacterized protein n=1 Tax=Synaphobranchus kaupii TaxID=118154 RepID=A0A9Q1IWT6_SYNKA|nr:hypothetical protein SKAU_G00184390 [Synaphobranchus kaupii]